MIKLPNNTDIEVIEKLGKITKSPKYTQIKTNFDSEDLEQEEDDNDQEKENSMNENFKNIDSFEYKEGEQVQVKEEKIENQSFKDKLLNFNKSSRSKIFLIFGLAIILILVFAFFVCLYKKIIVLPTLDDIENLIKFVFEYRNDHYYTVLIVFCLIYVIMQTFAIPGPIFLSLIAGALFGHFVGFVVVSITATLGASLCFLLSLYILHDCIVRILPSQRLNQLKTKIELHRNTNLFSYLLFLRITPLVPNVIINLVSPIINVPLITFVLATLIGLLPLNYIHVTAGTTLNNLHEELRKGGRLSIKSIFILFGIGLISLLPIIFKRRIEQFDDEINAAAVSNSKNDLKINEDNEFLDQEDEDLEQEQVINNGFENKLEQGRQVLNNSINLEISDLEKGSRKIKTPSISNFQKSKIKKPSLNKAKQSNLYIFDKKGKSVLISSKIKDEQKLLKKSSLNKIE